MAIAFIHEVPGLTQEQYKRVVREANPGGAPAAGSPLHMAGAMDGGWQIIAVWEAEEAAGTFYSSSAFQGALQRSNLVAPPPAAGQFTCSPSSN